MDSLFRIETDRAALTWGMPRGKEPTPVVDGLEQPPGLLAIHVCRENLSFGDDTWRRDVPAAVASDPGQTAGPRLYEQTDYKLYVQAKGDGQVSVVHRDPLICQELAQEDGGRVVHGYINFGSQVGHSVFTVLVDSHPEFDFEVEVFPSKLDYASDYQQLLAEVQDVLTGLALEYLRSTYRLGAAGHVPQPTHVEWLTLLRHVVDRLELGLQYVSRHPVRGLRREWASVRAERIQRCDSSVRTVIRRGGGSGPLMKLGGDAAVRQRLHERRARSTLDTPEHRWLRSQLERIQRRIGRLRREEAGRTRTKRREQTLHELDALKGTIARLARLEPLSNATGTPPAGFASLQLLAAPGYREAYQACLILSLGLRLEDGPVNLSVKDLSLLYEYWCYLALLRLVSEETGQLIPTEQLFAVRQRGLQVLLRRGHTTSVRFDTASGRKVDVTYNPSFHGASTLIPQRPDMLITFEDAHWPALHLVLDAKYRVEASPEYQGRYGCPGPPEDALNVLHRYRDAILEADGQGGSDHRPKHSVVQAAAAFPFRGTSSERFRDSKLWQALEHLGVGAVPLLPGDIEYLAEWLRSALQRGGWALADRAIPHRAWEQAQDWRIAAAEPVLVGVLRGGQERELLAWIGDQHKYYMPLVRTQRRQYAVRHIAIYSPTTLRHPPAVTHRAAVESVEIKSRRQIDTPWQTRGDPDALCVLYHLGQLRELRQPIENIRLSGRAQRFSQRRWTSRLGLERATTVKELLLETEPEWRLYEDLRAREVPFHLAAGRVRMTDPDDPAGRAWFELGDGLRVRYAGAAGFVVRRRNRRDVYVPRPEDVVERIVEWARGEHDGS